MTTEEIREELRLVIDPELGINVIDLGLIYDVRIKEEKYITTVEVDMTLTAMGCPLAGFLEDDVKSVIKHLGADDVIVNIVYDPPWTPDMLSDEVKDELGLL